MENICQELDEKERRNMRREILDLEKIKQRGEKITALYNPGSSWHRRYTITFFICEALNLVVVTAVWFSTNYFLKGRFYSYGHDLFWWFHDFPGLLTDGPNETLSPMDAVFPKVAKCTFHKFGYSGTQEKIDGLCVLPLNIINEKVYYFLWFWYLVGFILSFGVIIGRIILVTVPQARE